MQTFITMNFAEKITPTVKLIGFWDGIRTGYLPNTSQLLHLTSLKRSIQQLHLTARMPNSHFGLKQGIMDERRNTSLSICFWFPKLTNSITSLCI
jgi:hypothetical protein